MTPDRLKELLHYDPETGLFTHIIARGPCPAGSIAGCINAIGYVRICLDYIDYTAHRLAWLYVHGVMPPEQIDHRNGRRDDNRICNLRLADNSQNNQNRPLQGNNTSGYKGVSLHKKSGLWFAYAQAKGSRYSAGYHKTPEAASAASTALRLKLHGEFVNNDRKQVAL
ncbi:HNH endonuclease [Pseudomonas chlororaphis]|uniref:HNH endonuclease n=1 Tax=Pseudomonas chlororaphis TaxID=587753 RepID=UPI000BE2DD52|nr:HNH endonuclease [Pseudomonas chlororaphis]